MPLDLFFPLNDDNKNCIGFVKIFYAIYKKKATEVAIKKVLEGA
jgi:hypothetical protein